MVHSGTSLLGKWESRKGEVAVGALTNAPGQHPARLKAWPTGLAYRRMAGGQNAYRRMAGGMTPGGRAPEGLVGPSPPASFGYAQDRPSLSRERGGR